MHLLKKKKTQYKQDQLLVKVSAQLVVCLVRKQRKTCHGIFTIASNQWQLLTTSMAAGKFPNKKSYLSAKCLLESMVFEALHGVENKSNYN